MYVLKKSTHNNIITRLISTCLFVRDCFPCYGALGGAAALATVNDAVGGRLVKACWIIR